MSRQVFDVIDTSLEIDYASWCCLERGEMGKATSLPHDMLIDLALRLEHPGDIGGLVEERRVSRTPFLREKEYKDVIREDVCPRSIVWRLEPGLETSSQVTHLWSDSTQIHREVEMTTDSTWRPQVTIISKLDANGVETSMSRCRFLYEAHWASVYLDNGTEYRYLHAKTRIQRMPPFSNAWSTEVSSHEYLLVPMMREIVVFAPRFSLPLQVLPNGQVLNVFQTSNTSTSHLVRFPRFEGARSLYRARSRSPRRNRDA
jgi:hypothetical protein